MELINNRYKIEECLESDHQYSKFLVTDLFKKEQKSKVLLYLIVDSHFTKPFIHYCNKSIYEISSLQQPNIIGVHSYGIVDSIDDKKTKELYYFYTTEYIEQEKIVFFNSPLTKEDFLNIYSQLSRALDYLLFHGIVYKFLSMETITIYKENNQFKVKLLDLVSTKRLEISKKFMEPLNNSFKAPELTYDNIIGSYTDIYSLGSLLYYLLTYEEFNVNRLRHRLEELKAANDDNWKKRLLEIIMKMTQNDFLERYQTVHEINGAIEEVYGLGYKIEDKSSMECLNFRTPLVGREMELNKIINTIDKAEKSLILIHGDRGIGKTRLIGEVKHLLRSKKYAILNAGLSTEEYTFEKLATHLLRPLLKSASVTSFERYAKELVKLIPEIGINRKITPSKVLSEDKELLRLYDRVSNFMIEVTANQPTVITIDDFHLADQTAIEFIDYLLKINKVKKSPLVIILGFVTELYGVEDINSFISQWQMDGTALDFKLSRLTVEDTAEMIKHILGWRQEPLNFAAKILKETDGIPRYIEEIIRELFAQKILYVDYSSKSKVYTWHISNDTFANLKIMENIDEAIVRQLNTFDSNTRKILEAVSLFSSAVSLEIISKIIGGDIKYSEYLGPLTQLKILDEKLEDWGYTYSIYRKQLKEYIYSSIPHKEQVRLHKLISDILEDLYIREGRENKDELIYHLLKSNQKDKVIDYCIEAGDSMLSLRIYTQALVFFTKALNLMEDPLDERRLTLLMKVADIHQNQGKNRVAISNYIEVILLAPKMGKQEIMIDAKIKVGHIYLNRNELAIAEKNFEECIELSRGIDYHEGCMMAGYLQTRVYMHQKNVDAMEETANRYIQLSRRLGRIDLLGMFMSQLGVVEYYKGNYHSAMEHFQSSITLLEEGNKIEETCRPINNIGVILQEKFQNVNEARIYFERALKLAQQYHRIEDIIRYHNNIADAYMFEYNYEKAIDVLIKNQELTIEYEEETARLLGYSNLVESYINLADYKNAYKYLMKALKECQPQLKISLYTEGFVISYAKFYIKMGLFDRALEIFEEYAFVFKQKDSKEYLSMKSWTFFCRLNIGEKVEASELLSVLDLFRESKLIRDRRLNLLKAASYFYSRGDMEITQKLLAEDEALISEYDNEFLEINRGITLYRTIDKDKSNSIQKLEELLLKVINTKYKELTWKTYNLLGEAYLQIQDYYKATSCFLDALEAIQQLLNKVPDEFKGSYLINDEKYKIKQRLLLMENAIRGNQLENCGLLDIAGQQEDNLDLNDFFDNTRFKELFQNETFYNLALEQYKKMFPIKVDNTGQLLESFTNDPVYNLDLLLRLSGKYVLATKGVFLGATEEGLERIASFGQDVNIDEITHIIDKLSTSSFGILVDNSTDNGGEPLVNDAKALICIPIQERHSRPQRINNDQRRWTPKDQNRIEGYLYLETNKVFNNFSYEAFYECKKLTNLSMLLLENYFLKIYSSIDKLTGAYIRKHFEKVFREKLEVAKEANQTFSIIMADIDHFKNVNDTYGHQRGDLVLAEVGRVVKDNIRSTDYFGRYGGEEFIILLPNTDKQDAFLVAEKIRERFKKANLLGEDVELTISCGISSFPKDGISKETIIEKADRALYTAKEKGRNKTIIWEEGLGFSDKRIDKLAGVVTGNIVQDQRNVLALAEVIELLTDNKSLEEKAFNVMGRLIEILEADECMLFVLKDVEVESVLCRRRFYDEWLNQMSYNEKLLNRVILSKQGEYLIDWEDISHIDILTGTPNWKSVMLIPIFYNGILKGIMYFTVPAKEKEFDFASYNLAKIASNVMGAFIANK